MFWGGLRLLEKDDDVPLLAPRLECREYGAYIDLGVDTGCLSLAHPLRIPC